MGTPPLRCRQGELLIESQAADGLRLWAEHFEAIVWAVSCIPETIAEPMHCIDWTPVRSIRASSPVSVLPLPWSFDLRFIRDRSAVESHLSRLISTSRYTQFALGGSWSGCWARVAAAVAMRARHPFSVHMETVLPSVAWAAADTLTAKLKYFCYYPLTQFKTRPILQEAALVQCNGMDTFNHYFSQCGNPFLIHNIHATESDLIQQNALTLKRLRLAKNAPLRIHYSGRLISLKGPLEWLQALSAARERGAVFKAAWMGDGEMKPAFLRDIQRLDLQECVTLIPFESNRFRVLQFLEDADLLLFTHLSLESSRVQKEALIKGTPIVGYRTAYAEELISGAGGGVMSEMRNPVALGCALNSLDKDRVGLAKLFHRAALDGRRFVADWTFAERAKSIRAAIDTQWQG